MKHYRQCGAAFYASSAYWVLIIYGVGLIALGCVDFSVGAFVAVCCTLGCLSVIIGFLGQYGIWKSNVLALQTSQILLICQLFVFFILTTILLVDTASPTPVLLPHSPPQPIRFILETKALSSTIIVFSYAIIFTCCYFSTYITSLTSNLETIIYAGQIARWKKNKSLENIQKSLANQERKALLHTESPTYSTDIQEEQDTHNKPLQETYTRESSDSGSSAITEVWFTREPPTLQKP